MRARLKTIPIVQLLGFLIAAALLAAADASAFRLSMDGGNSLRVDTPAALYASDANGRLVKIVARGERVPGGGTIADFGTPVLGADGSVIFGADVRGEGHLGWNLFLAAPNASGAVRIAPALSDSDETAGCHPSLKSDPQPVVTGDGSFVFIASDQVGRSTLFRYSKGHLDCPIRTGDRTVQGHVISSLGFGTAASAADGSVIFGGSIVEGDSVGQRDIRASILLIGPRSRAHEIAVEGNRTEDGERYGRGFGLPSISSSTGGDLVSFVNRGQDSSSLFVGPAEHPHRATSTGVGTLTYLSAGRPSLAEDGAVAIKAASGDHAMIVVVRSGEPLVVARDADHPAGMVVTNTDPAGLRAGKLYVEAVDAQNREHVLSLSTPQLLGGAPLQGATRVMSGALSVYPESVSVNRKGAVAFLEESDEPSARGAAAPSAASDDTGSI